MISDFFLIFYWWVLLLGLGIIFLPLTWTLFRKFFDQGYAFSKIIAILSISYLVWFLGSLKLLPFFTETIWLVIIAAATGNFLLFNKKRQELKGEVKKSWKIFVFEEILFLIVLALWSFIRGFQPGIQGLEKFMDFGFVNSILRSQYFPPADMWLAGKTINYYYFGHLVTAVLTKLSGIDSAITYNLMIATIFALSFTATFSLGGNLIYLNYKSQALNPKQILNSNFPNFKLFGILDFGNWNLFRNSDLGFRILGAGLLSAMLLTLGGNLHPLYWFLSHKFSFVGYWYPDATRFIVKQFGAADNTIHEFPIYSFVVADLHGHLLNLPFVLLFISLLFSLVIENWSASWRIGNLILPGLILAVFYMTNAWDFPIYFLIFGAIILWLNYQKYGLTLQALSKTFLFSVFCFLFFILFSLPFHLNFKSIAEGIALTDFHSPWWMLLVLWGFPLITTIAFIIFLIRKKKQISDQFILILLIISWFLILIPEIFYIKDIYIHDFQRANTMFKLTYQSFVMFSLVTGYILVRILTNIKRNLLKFFFVIFNFSFLVFIFVYPYFAIRPYYGLKTYQGLYGLNYLKNLYPYDYQAILWLRQNISGQPVIVEAVGESYTDFARVSANTGLPTILGWPVHEWLWRGSYDEAGVRSEEVKMIYESKDINESKRLLKKYNTRYVFLGTLEKEKYPRLNENQFYLMGEIVFKNERVKIFHLSEDL